MGGLWTNEYKKNDDTRKGEAFFTASALWN
jgi:hypothetical protein